MDEGLTIQEAADRVGLSIDTLRYYERAGLLPHVVRTMGGQRRYDAANLNGIHFVTKMRATGMPIRRIRDYMCSPVQSDGTSGERRAILVEHRESVLAKIQELNEALALIERKIALYDSDGLGCSPGSSAVQESAKQQV
jgi:MerR family transcriptional regulator, aldehyde-responsive regulator